MNITMLLRVALLLTGLGFLASAPEAQERRPPDAIARALQARYQGIRDFSADFVQTYRGGVLRTQTSERGTVAIKKPGRMRWLYTSPERKEFVSDGQKIYSVPDTGPPGYRRPFTARRPGHHTGALSDGKG